MSDTPDLGRMLGYCAHLGMQYNNRLLRQAGYDVTPVQSHVLIYLSCQGEQAVNQRDLEQELHLKPSTVNGIVSRLEEKGCITRKPSPTDGRCRLLRLTALGQSKVHDFHAVMSGAEQWLTGCLSEAEEATMRALLSRIIENLENEVNKA